MKNKMRGIVFAMGLACLMTAPANADVIFADNFNRADSNTVGNGWTEWNEDDNDVAIRDNQLRLRDTLSTTEDALVAQLSLSTVGFTNIWLAFDWAPISESGPSDDLYVQWRVGPAGAWNNIAQFSLGGSGFTSESYSLGAGANGVADFEFRFWTNVSDGDEGAWLDNVRLTGDRTSSVPEPASLGLMGLGLLGLGFGRRKRTAD